MSNYRQIHTKIWKDAWFLDLEPAQKLFFIYLFSNERASLAGIYELPLRVMSFETGIPMQEINEALDTFSDNQKAYYEDGVLWLTSFRKYHDNPSPKVQTRIIKDLKDVKDCRLKGIYCKLYGIDTVSIDENSVSIPPITITTTSTTVNSITDKGGLGGNNQYSDHQENSNQQYLDTLAAICNVIKNGDPVAPSPELERCAHWIMELEAVDKIPGFTEWWKVNGYYAGRPAFKSFTGEFQNYLDGVTLKGKKTKEQKDIIAAQKSQRMKDEYQFQS